MPWKECSLMDERLQLMARHKPGSLQSLLAPGVAQLDLMLLLWLVVTLRSKYLVP
jgi:hypothetical protein